MEAEIGTGRGSQKETAGQNSRDQGTERPRPNVKQKALAWGVGHLLLEQQWLMEAGRTRYNQEVG